MDLKYDNKFTLIQELYRLSQRYDVFRLEYRLTEELYEKSYTSVKTKNDFNNVWTKMRYILKIAFQYKIEKLLDKVMEFMDKNMNHFLNQGNELLIQYNDYTDGRLFTLMVDKSHENRNKLKTKLRDQIKELLNLMSKKCKKLNQINERQKQVKRLNGD